MKLGLDLRGLNFRPRTGVNTYTLHMLFQLNAVLQTRPDLKITAIGLRDSRFEELASEFPWLNNLFAKRISLAEYLRLPKILHKFRFINDQTFLLNGFLAFYNLFFQSIDATQVAAFDLLFLPQPKPILKNPKTPLVIMIHDVYAALDGDLLPPLEAIKEGKKVYKKLMNNSQQIWVNSISTGNDIVNFFAVPSRKIKLVYLSLPIWGVLTNTPKSQTKTDLSAETTYPKIPKSYVLALSGIEPRKNWHNLLMAQAYLQKHYPDYDLELVLAGTVINQKYKKSLEKLIVDHKIQNVHWFLSPDEILKHELIERSEFLAYPSFYEGFGFPILEAFQHHKAVLTSKISSMPEIGKESALYINPFNSSDIARGLYILAKDAKYRAELESKTALAFEQYSWTETQISLETVIDKFRQLS